MTGEKIFLILSIAGSALDNQFLALNKSEDCISLLTKMRYHKDLVEITNS